ncbi:DHA2 family efflux MFS transporter permease subunit [Dongia rigui]|uniref:DHA2 family efflux MFS transporter permease subunit n=1 Tax=Dongia rigui TaxID=940149 RepID=A0ABU5DXJ6_9PROT|nr:DHA2 family efflux MFS transporter permease subunit [Dongia rigui]MDY0871995.1 DHA2 family efflux MFS transporter permease subunit [Dongia rigui]
MTISAKSSPMLITFSVMLATIMQALDTTIANVALPHMQGTLSATQDQISWVLTSYIVAAGIMTPATGFLSQRFGRKRLFVWSVIGFTLASLLCGAAFTLNQIVLYRLLQGVFGAALVPLSQAILLDTFPREQHGKAMAMWGVGVMIGPILGPTLGGLLTEYYNWRWVFLINLPFGILALSGILAFVPETPKDPNRPFDFLGFAFLAIAIGALQMMLDRGELQAWFESPEIVIEGLVAALALYMFIAHMFTHHRPFLDRHLFVDRNFVTGLVFIFIIGIILLATMALLPPFLQHLKGYPVVTTGYLLAPRGIGTMVSMMLVGRVMGKIDTRLLILAGLALTSLSLWQMGRFSLDVTEFMLVESGVIQGLGLGLIFVPLSTITFSTLAPHLRTEAAAMFSLMRNIGSSIGISIVTALLSRNSQINHAGLSEHVSIFNPLMHAPYLPPSWSLDTTTGLLALDAEVNRQAASIAYIDDFVLMMWVTLCAVPLLLLLRKPRAVAGTPAPALHAVAD